MRCHSFLAVAVLASVGVLATASHAAVLTVQATDNIYGAGEISPPGGGTLPGGISVSGGETLTITSTGSITYNAGNYNDPDGIGSVSGEGINATNGYSGINAPHAGVLLGLFVGATIPVDNSNPPATLTYSSDADTAFASASPLVNQVFLIGDGLTGDGTGSVQNFIVPSGATYLYLGFADAGGYYGDPGSYGDNYGSFTTTVTGANAPEPATLGMLALAGLPLLAKRRRSRA